MKRRVLGIALLAAGLTRGVHGTVAIERPNAAGLEVTILALEGGLVAATGDAGVLAALVAPADAPDGERRLLVWRAAAPSSVAERAALPGWIKTLALADLGSGAELLAGGLGELATFGPLAGDAAAAPRALVRDADFDLRSLAPGRLRAGVERTLAAASAGKWRAWRGADGALRLIGEHRLPLAARVERGGLRLSSPPGRVLGAGTARELVVFGPEPQGAARLRALLFPVGADAFATEAWCRLPAAESVEQSAFLRFDGTPYLVVRTQASDTVNLFEKVRLRVLPLETDRTRAGRPATFAAELDTRRWHDLEFAAADQDGDGRDDLLVARPEGFRGEDLVVEVYAGQGGGRFAPRPRRFDLDGPFQAFRFADDLDGDGRVDLALAARGALELRRGSARGAPVERAAPATVALGGAASGRTAVTLGVGGGQGSAESERSGEIELLGALPLDDGRSALLVLIGGAAGRDRLAVVAPAKR